MALDTSAGGAVLLDKDGTLLQDVPYNVDPGRIRLAESAGDALRRLARLGMPLAVVSNQPGVALGRFDEPALEAVRHCLSELFARHGARLSGFFYCPHHPAGQVSAYAMHCLCRKPAPGLLRRACSALGCDPAQSWMVGDILDDVEAGRRAGCGTVLVDCGNETEWVGGALRTPDFIVPTLERAAQVIAAGLPVSPSPPLMTERPC
ncbi:MULTISPECIES: D-glycero-alpha-D-manno-heptose-1,7-bisphosphate 7-phosphatase [Cupriavidus]|uniref:D,D-heptose 1,7-bisphosphate phosphatase n=1 Tax=Cupriavidus pauculus TaxID=82633 RepID=A0A3G8H6X2_9BURK|nr:MULTISPECIES: HAD-IIIA family hydrolase [Cupriavidus]AZG16297.1 HAD-IIIA family hydrolase [Cupriavidus pauculus]MDT6963334.1 HAD-IIIA family hydrolase [Cupriavidus sp. SZY C1]